MTVAVFGSAPSSLRDALSGGLTVPGLVKVGTATLVLGVLFDVSEHSFGPRTAAGSGFSLGEHAAHLVVLVGMVVILLGVIADGVRASGRHVRQEGSQRDAIR